MFSKKYSEYYPLNQIFLTKGTQTQQKNTETLIKTSKIQNVFQNILIISSFETNFPHQRNPTQPNPNTTTKHRDFNKNLKDTKCFLKNIQI